MLADFTQADVVLLPWFSWVRENKLSRVFVPHLYPFPSARKCMCVDIGQELVWLSCNFLQSQADSAHGGMHIKNRNLGKALEGICCKTEGFTPPLE